MHFLADFRCVLCKKMLRIKLRPQTMKNANKSCKVKIRERKLHNRSMCINIRCNALKIGSKFVRVIEITRWAWQSQTWGHPAPQVRVESQFKYSKFLSQQYEQTTPKTVSLNHVAYGLASAYSVRALRMCQYPCPYVFRFRPLEIFGEDIPTSPDVIEAQTL